MSRRALEEVGIRLCMRKDARKKREIQETMADTGSTRKPGLRETESSTGGCVLFPKRMDSEAWVTAQSVLAQQKPILARFPTGRLHMSL